MNLNDLTRMEKLKIINGVLWQMEEKLRQVTLELKNLETRPRINAGLHWRSGKYLYLIHPAKQGQRKREYIGSDPDKIATAEAAVSNFHRHTELCRQKRNLTYEISTIDRRIDNIVWSLNAQQQPFEFIDQIQMEPSL